LYIEDITCPRVDMNFICVQLYISWVCTANKWDIELNQGKLNFVSTSGHVIFCLLHKHTNDDVFDNFLKISTHFKMIFRINFYYCSEGQTNTFKHFPNISWRLPKTTRRCFDHTSTNLSVVKGTKEKCHQKGMISSQCERSQ